MLNSWVDNVLNLKELWLPCIENFVPKLKLGIPINYKLKVVDLMLKNQKVWGLWKV